MKEWFLKPGDQVKQFDDTYEVQSDKASVTITSRYDGLIKTLHYKIDNVALVGSTLLDFEIEDNSTGAVRNDAGETAKSSENQTIDNSEKSERRSDKVKSENITLKEEKVLSTTAVRRITKENNIKLTDDGKVLKEDILAHLQKISANPRVKVNVPSSMTRKMANLKRYTKHTWKTMTKSLIDGTYMKPVIVSADHRIVDDVTMARFSNLWKYYVENLLHLLICP
ncbi:ODB2 dehydrogenase, partial [Pseudoatta argentina]